MNNKQPAKAPARVDVACPHCSSVQKESPHAKSTICFSCGEHFEVNQKRPSNTVLSLKGGLTEKATTATAKPGFFSGLVERFSKPKERDIRCFQCKHRQTVSSSATSTICPKCSSYIELQSYKIAGGFSRELRTQGEIIITPSGDLGSSKAHCSSALVQGNVRGNLLCSGTIIIKRKGRISGTLNSEKVVIDRKSVVEFLRVLRVHDLEINGRLDANVIATGTVRISSKGWLKGEVTARGISVDRGGEFHGSLTIGKQDLPLQTELLPLTGEQGGEDAQGVLLDLDAPAQGHAG